MTYTASIAISIFYRPVECLQLVFESLLKESLDSQLLELFVCDDCSPVSVESITEMIDRYRPRFGRIQHFRHLERDGFRKTFLLRQALEQSSGEIFVFLDGDCVLQNGALGSIVAAAQARDSLCQGQRVFLRSESIDWGLQNLASITDFRELRDRFYADNTKTRKNIKRYRDSRRAMKAGATGRFLFASGHLMAIRSSILKEIGMNTSNGRGYVEDTDLAKRLFEEKGVDLYEIDGAEVLHLFEHH